MIYETKDSQYSYEVIGEGEPVLLLHGFTGSKQTWSSLSRELSNHYQVITIDLPGHGETSTPPKVMEQCCEDISKFLQYINVERAHVIGYSMGGRIALSFAMLYKDQVASLALESSSPGLETKQERDERVTNDQRLAEKIINEGVEVFVSFWEEIPLFDTQKRLPYEVKEVIRKERLSQLADGLANSLIFMGTGVQPSWWSNLNQLTIPTLLVVGEWDEKFVMLNEQMQKEIPNSVLENVKGAGHAVHLEKSEIFNQVIKSFLHKQIEGGTC